MGKQKTTIILILSLLLTLNGILFVDFARANPYMYHKQVSPPAGSKPLNIVVYSPFNNSVCNNSDVKITLNINNQDTRMSSLLDAYLKADWLQENTTIYKQNTYSPEFPQSWNYANSFSNIPEGEHSFTIYALGHGMYATNEGGLTANSYTMTAVSTVIFRIDTVPPEISIISTPTPKPTPKPTPISIATAEPPAAPGIMLNIKSFPTLVTASVSLAAVIIGIGLFVYFKKRK
jgi:hypothetical protein